MATLDRCYHRPVDECSRQFDREPAASALGGAGALRGAPQRHAVAVKVLRPGIEGRHLRTTWR